MSGGKGFLPCWLRHCQAVGCEIWHGVGLAHAYPVNAHTHYMWGWGIIYKRNQGEEKWLFLSKNRLNLLKRIGNPMLRRCLKVPQTASQH